MNAQQYAKLYGWYRLPLVRLVRLIAYLGLMYWLVADLANDFFPQEPLLFAHLLFMWEVFYRYKVARYHPKEQISGTQQDPYTIMTLPALASGMQLGIKGLVKDLLRYPQVRFMLQRATITSKEVQFVDIAHETLLQKALDIATQLHGKHITTMDLLAAYMVLTEPQTKVLFGKALKEHDIVTIAAWARMQYPVEETMPPLRMRFHGEGFGEALLTGWTLETKKYTTDFTYEALQRNPVIDGREQEFQRLLSQLTHNEANNVLLVGEPGSGKETLVAYLASESFQTNLPGTLNHKRVYQLLVGALLAGASDRSVLEERLQAIIAEIAHSGNVILYIPSFEDLLGSSSFNLDLSGALLPYLQHGAMPIIASMTPGNYKAYMEKSALREVFEVITLNEPKDAMVLAMLFDNVSSIERKERVRIAYSAVDAAVEHARQYSPDGVLPGAAVGLLADAAHTVVTTSRDRILRAEHVIAQVEQRTHIAVGAPSGEEKKQLLHLEESLHQRVIGQDHAVTAVADALRRRRTGVGKAGKPVSFLFLGPTGVGKTQVAKVLADTYFGGEAQMLRFDMSEYTDETGMRRLLGALPGEGDARGELTEKVKDHPASLILLDEFEKAHAHIHNMFLQMLDDGRLTDNRGQTVSFANTMVIATSNAGSEFIREAVAKGTTLDKQFHQSLLDMLQTNHIFTPELLNRFDEVIVFEPLQAKEQTKIVELLLEDVRKQLAEKDITVLFDDKVMQKIIAEGMHTEFGARPLKRYIADTIEDLLAKKQLTDEIKRGDTIHLTVDENNTFVTAFTA